MTPRPPRIATLIVRRSIEPTWIAGVEAALDEEFSARLERSGTTLAQLWYWRQALLFVGAALCAWCRDLLLPLRDPGSGKQIRQRRLAVLVRDVRFALRRVSRHPLPPLAAALSLALGLGAGTALLTVLDRTLIHPLGVESPEQLVTVYHASQRNPYGALNFADYVDYRDRSSSFSTLTAFFPSTYSVSTESSARSVNGMLVSENYFEVLGVQALLGRSLNSRDVTPSLSGWPVVLSHTLWQSLFGADDGVIGRVIRVNGHPFEVAGVMPADFRGHSLVSTTAVWLPLMSYDDVATGFYASFKAVDYTAQRTTNRRLGFLTLLGRLEQGHSLRQASLELSQIAEDLEREFQAGSPAARPSVVPATLAAVGARSRPDLVRLLSALLIAVAMVVVASCANISNLLLADAHRRRREIALRTAIGASRGSLVRQWLTESVCLALVAAALSLWAAWLTVRLMQPFTLPGGISLESFELALDWRLAATTLLLSLAVSLVFGVLPALSAARTEAARFLGARGNSPGRSGWLRNGLLSAQVAMALVLLASAGLFFRSVAAALEVDLGFEPDEVLVATIDFGEQGYSEERALAFYQHVKADLKALPGVESVAATDTPFGRSALSVGSVYVADRGEKLTQLDVLLNRTEPDYFRTLQIPLLQGRAFHEDDSDPSLVLVSQGLARRLWPGESALGKRFNFSGPEGGLFEVIGVTGPTLQQSLQETPPDVVYRSFLRNPADLLGFPISIVIRSDGNPSSFVPAFRRAVETFDTRLAVASIAPLSEHVAGLMMPQRLGRVLLGGLSLVAALVMAVGVYASVAFTLRQRRREFGIRLAIGADRRRIATQVASAGLTPTVAGLLVGLLVLVPATGVLSAFLFGVESFDPWTLGSVMVLVVGIAATACVPLVLQARRIDPMSILRAD